MALAEWGDPSYIKAAGSLEGERSSSHALQVTLVEPEAPDSPHPLQPSFSSNDCFGAFFHKPNLLLKRTFPEVAKNYILRTLL